MTELSKKIIDPDYVPLLFGLTPPAADTDPGKLAGINRRRIERLGAAALDGLCLYDIQDESVRADSARPYENRRFMDPSAYRQSLAPVSGLETVSYCAVGCFASGELSGWIEDISPGPMVFVGKPGSNAPAKTSLKEAYGIYAHSGKTGPLGGVCIPERHSGYNSEAERMAGKIANGVNFFVTQCIYDPASTERMLVDYARICEHIRVPPKKILFTFSPAGSAKAVGFFKWLGVRIPEKTEKRILEADDPLAESTDILEESAAGLARNCGRLGIPFGMNVESVISKKEDFLAAVGLAAKLQNLISRHREPLAV